MKTVTTINIQTSTVIKIALVLVLFSFLFVIREILAILFVSLILSSAIDPIVDWMQKRKIPRALGMMIIYFSIIFVLSAAMYLIIPPIVDQGSDLVKKLPQFLGGIGESTQEFEGYLINKFPDSSVSISKAFDSFSQNLTKEHFFNILQSDGNISGVANTIGGFFSKISGVFGGIISFFLVTVITFYMVVEENAMKKIVWSIAPKKHQVYIVRLMNKMQKKIGLWLRGQLILSFIIFLLTYVGLLTLGMFGEPVEYALILALIAGLTEFVPYLGPLIASIPAVFLSFTTSWMLGLSVAVLYYVVQLCENHIIVPKLMQRVVGLNPVVSIIVLLIGFKIGAIPGAILAIPVTTALSVLVDDLFLRKEAKELE